VGRVSAIKCFEIALMRQAGVNAFPRKTENAALNMPRMAKECPPAHRVLRKH
jgi:hypothetical protein